MTRKHRRITVLALALVIAALLAPSASAVTFEEFHSGARDPAPPTQVRVVQAAPNPGFDWGDAGIGAGAAFALTMIGVGGLLLVTNRRAHREGVATTA